MTQTDEAGAVEELRHGSGDALGRIMNAYAGYVAAVVWYVAGGRLTAGDAEEISADVFVALWRNAGKVHPGKLKGYLGSIARSRTIDALRKAGREPEFEDDELPASEETAESETEKRLEREAVHAAVDALPEPDREIFLRHYFLCRTVSDISADTGINPNTVKSRLRRGREVLRDSLIKGGFFDE